MKLKKDPKAYAIMGCAMRVHSTLGSGFLESAYGDALEIEFANAGIPFVREDEVRIFYGGQPLKTAYRADFTCYEREYIVELKAVRAITKIEWAQVIHYMRATQIKCALLVNFGRERIQYDTFDIDHLPAVSVLDGSAPATKSRTKASFTAVNAECGARSPAILQSGTAERSETAEGRESHTDRSFSIAATGTFQKELS